MNKESNQRAELHRKIWAIADEVRGAVDGWDFKQYILGILFYRYISENLCQYFNEAEKEAGNDSFDYAIYPDEDAIRDFKNEAIKIKGFFILPSQLFQNITTNALTNENL
ncbi:type I restriction-modification system subunit M N-terminal domain-containing protein, partial [[Mycoplasma] anseris]